VLETRQVILLDGVDQLNDTRGRVTRTRPRPEPPYPRPGSTSDRPVEGTLLL